MSSEDYCEIGFITTNPNTGYEIIASIHTSYCNSIFNP